MKDFGKIVNFLILLGGINWGLVGLFGFDVIQYVLGETWLDRVLYALIGFSALYRLANWRKKA